MPELRTRPLELTPWLEAELLRRADVETPKECCGFISRGKDAKIALWGASNAAERPRTTFLIAPDDQRGIMEQVWKRGEEVVGVYHSHPRSGPEPSESDRAIAASLPPLWWVIVGRKVCTCVAPGPELETPGCDDCKGEGILPDFWAGVLP